MFYLTGIEECLQTLLLVSTLGDLSSCPTSLSDVAIGYRRFISRVQPTLPSAPLKLMIITDPLEKLKLLNEFNRDSQFNDTRHFIADSDHLSNTIETDVSNIYVSLDYMRAKDPAFANLFEILFNRILIAPCKTAYGGTTSRAIGVLWIDPRPSWGLNDYLEFYIHEATHTLLFLDEWRYTHFTDPEKMSQRENYALSAIQQIHRPLDKVLHSIVVATELFASRKRLIGHPITPAIHPVSSVLIEGVIKSLNSVASLSKVNDLLTRRSFDLLERCKREFYSIERAEMAGTA